MTPSRTITKPNAQPNGIALDADNNLYVLFWNHGLSPTVYKFAPGSSSSGTNLGLTFPQGYEDGIVFDRAGEFLIAIGTNGYQNFGVYVYPPGSKTFSRMIAPGSPHALALDRHGKRIFVTNSTPDIVYEYRVSDGEWLGSESQGTAGAPSGVAVDPPE
jgi:DNA-binding beta-propeller fold protein YncE